ncbi:hypothetical protein D3C84_679140 [compost metagenome]
MASWNTIHGLPIVHPLNFNILQFFFGVKRTNLYCSSHFIPYHWSADGGAFIKDFTPEVPQPKWDFVWLGRELAL